MHSPPGLLPPHPSGEGRIRSIAVATDPPGEPGNALPFAIRLAQRLRGRLLLDPVHEEGSGRQRYIVVYPKASEGSIVRSGSGERRRQGLAAGEVHPSAARTAGDFVLPEPQPDLLVLGSRVTRSGRYSLGPDLRQAFDGVEVPCLIAREALSLPLRRVLLPVDRSGLAYGVISHAVDWLTSYLRTEADAGNPGRSLELHVLHVARHGVEERLMDIELTDEIRRVLGEAGPKPPVPIRKLVHPGGDPGSEILRVAERHTADLIVMPAFEGRSWIRRLTGSVSSALLRQARCPLLLLPPRSVDATRRACLSAG